MTIRASAALAAALMIVSASISTPSADAATAVTRYRLPATAQVSGQVVYVSESTKNRILIYPSGSLNAIAAITRGIVDAKGIAVDRYGDLYVANGNGGNVLEYAPGGSGPIRTYVAGLHHPVNVALDASDNLYVAEQSPSSIVKFMTKSNGNPAVYPLPFPNDPVRGVAIDPTGNIFASISGIANVFPIGLICLSVSQLYVIPAGKTVPILKFLRANEQTFGLAVDPAGTLYASDPCLNNVAAYSLPTLSFKGYLHDVDAFNEPFYLTIANGYLSVPSAGEGLKGFVTIVDMNARSRHFQLHTGLQGAGPISAVVGSLPAR